VKELRDKGGSGMSASHGRILLICVSLRFQDEFAVAPSWALGHDVIFTLALRPSRLSLTDGAGAVLAGEFGLLR